MLLTANAVVVARGLLRRLGSCSPPLAGFIAGAGSTAALYALHACIEGQLDAIPYMSALPEVNGCHCWLIGVAGFVVGALSALLIALVRRLLEPLVALLCESLLGILAAGSACGLIRRQFQPSFSSRRQPLARRLAGRAPPLIF